MSIPSTPLNQSVTATTSNGALVAPMNFLTNTDNLNTIANGVGFVNGTLPVSKGGTNATSLTGYVKGNGAATFTASPTVPSTDITGLGTMSVQNANTVAITGGNITGITDLAIADGGTGASTASGARTNLGLGTIATQNANAVAITGGNITGITDLAVSDGGTGASTLTGYVKGNGTSALTAVGTIPSSDITGLGTMSTQNATNVTITGGNITGITDLAVSDGGTGASTLTGYVKGNGTSALTASGTIPNTDITGLGTMSTQNANNVTITGGNITGITALPIASGGTGANTAANARTNLGLGTIATQNSNTVSITGGNITGITDLAVADGGTGASTLTGYVKGNGTLAFTAVGTIPNTDITGLGSMSTQNASTVAITGGNITGITDLAIADGGTGASTAANARTNLGLGTIATQNSNAVSITGGNITGITDLAVADGGTGASSLTGYIKGNGTLAFTAVGTIPNTDITGLGSMSTQSASNVAITGGNITGITALGVASGGTGLAVTPNNGALLIGNGTGYQVNTLTSGFGINITNGSGAITIASTITGMYWKGPYSSTTFYYPNDVVEDSGSSYISLVENQDYQPNEYLDRWALVAQMGAAGTNGTNGTNGTSFVWKGAFIGDGETYNVNDVVSYIGSSWVCILYIDEAFGGEAPPNSTYWNLMAYGFSSPVTIAQGGTNATTASGARTNLGLGSIATQNANAVAITGGNITGITDLAVSDGGTGASTLTGYVKGNGTAALVAVGTIPYTDITGLGTMSTQNSSNISVTGGSMNNVALGTPVSVVLTNGTGLPLATGVTGTLPIANGGTGQTAANPAFNALAPAQTGNNGKYLTTDGSNTSWAALVGGGTVTSVNGTGTVSGISLSGNVTISGSLSLGGALDLSSPPAIGSNVPNTAAFTDAYATTISSGFTNVASAGTVTTLTASSVRDWTVTGSSGQTYQLPDATTLRNGAMYKFNNNQSSGTIVVRNNSATTIVTIQSGGYVEVILLSNATAAGSWDVHNQAPSNVTWSTNTFDYPGSITSATWNGNVVTINRGGTNAATAQAAINNLAGATTSGYYLRGNGSNVVMAAIQAVDVPTLNQNTTGNAATLATPRAIYGNNFDGSAALTQVIASTYGGTGNGYAKFSGPTTAEKTFTLPDANATLLYAGGPLGTPSSGTLSNATGLPVSTGVSGLGTNVATALATNVGTSGAFVVNGGALGTPTSGTLTNATGLPVSTGISGLGTNVSTALATNVGTTGAFVVNGGALGTPSSGTLTNATGLPVGTGISGLGTNVATALATNVGTSGAFVVNGGALGTPSSGTLSNATGLPLTTGVTGVLPVANGGTNATSAGQATAKLAPITSTVTSATTVTLTNASTPVQIFTGTASQVLVLPVTSTLETGWTFTIVNNSTANISIQTSAGTALFTALSATNTVCRCIATGSTAVTDWEAGITEFSGYAGQGGSVMMSFSPSATGAMSFTGSAASNSVFGTANTTGTLTIGGTAQTGLTTIGQSTVGNTIGIGTGVTATGNTQTINIGTAGASGSTTAITIGGTANTSTITFNGTSTFSTLIASGSGGTGNGFTKFSGPTTAERTFTLPDSNATLLYSGGALGTPSSGTVTNLTGTASININGTVGATTASTGAFTTLSASSTGLVTGTFGVGAAPVSEKMRVQAASGYNFVVDSASSSLRISSVNDADSANVPLILQGSTIKAQNSASDYLSITGSSTITAAIANSVIGTFSSTGLAVTGTISSTGALTVNSTAASPIGLTLIGDNSSYNPRMVFKTGTGSAGGKLDWLDSSSVLQARFSYNDSISAAFEWKPGGSTNAMSLTSTGLAVTGAVSLTTTLSITNSSTSADVMLSRPSTALGATLQYKTGATLNWYHGTRGLSDNNWYLFNNNLSTNTLIISYADNTATFAGSITMGGWPIIGNDGNATYAFQSAAAITAYTAGASMGTLTNAPSAGNPTKWITINDNGTLRRIPTW